MCTPCHRHGPWGSSTTTSAAVPSPCSVTLVAFVQQLDHSCSLPARWKLCWRGKLCSAGSPAHGKLQPLMSFAPADHQCCRNRSSHFSEAGEGTRILGHRGRGGRCATPRCSRFCVWQPQTHLRHCKFLSVTILLNWLVSLFYLKKCLISWYTLDKHRFAFLGV